MIETKIKEGNYASIENVVVVITETETITNKKEVEVSESTILATIAQLNERKANLLVEVNAEIALNNEMLTIVRSVNRANSITQ